MQLALIAASSGGEVKHGSSCGCTSSAYSTYGAGQDSCVNFTEEFNSNPDSNKTDTNFAQTLGWIAGYVSATNRHSGKRDIFNAELDYLAFSIARWCLKNPQATLSDAMDSMTDKLKKQTGTGAPD